MTMYAKKDIIVLDENIEDVIASDSKIDDLKMLIDDGRVVIIKNVASRQEIDALRTYLIGIRKGTLPEFVPIREGAKNNYRINFEDPRAQITSFFHVWSFYNWNQDIFNLYQRYSSVYKLRNLIAGLPASTFLDTYIEHGCAARLSVQFYPKSRGFFALHEDPYDKHQLVVPIMAMSEKGVDFHVGGNFVKTSATEELDTEAVVKPGDLVLFNALCGHGVNKIDPKEEFDPLSNEGRWMMLFAVNKTADNTEIKNAKAL